MSDSEAASEAARRGLFADTAFGWCNLRRHALGRCIARGGTWAETFGRLDAQAQASVETIAAGGETIPAKLQRPCPRCQAGIGERCRNYRGQVKFICPARLKAPADAEPPAVQQSLFD